MIGLLLIYFIGKSFYKLAKKHEKSSWLFALLGIAVYYGMSFIGSTVIVLIAISAQNEFLLTGPELVIGVLGIPVGLLAAWGLHYILRKNWEGKPNNQHPDLLDKTDFS